MYSKMEKLLHENEVSAYKVAKDLGFSQSLFPRWRDGISVPKVDKVMKICDYFNVPISYFYEDDGKQ